LLVPISGRRFKFKKLEHQALDAVTRQYYTPEYVSLE
jgi:hypothetical protein